MEKLEPESAYALALIGEMRQRQGRFTSAFHLYRKALAKKPGLPGIHTAIARIYRETGHADWAQIEESQEKRAPRSTPRTGSVEAYYGEVRRANEAASEAFRRLAELPASVEVFQFLAENARIQDRHLDEVKHWRAVLELAPSNRAFEIELAYALHLARDHQAAQVVLERLVQTEPESPRLNFMLGDTLLSQQKADQALPYLRKAVSRDGKLIAARSALGRALIQVGQAVEALPHLKAALPTDKDGALHFQIAQAYRASGQEGLAKQALAEYQRLRANADRDRSGGEEPEISAPSQ
jgi:predicted Zn-dependent protease